MVDLNESGSTLPIYAVTMKCYFFVYLVNKRDKELSNSCSKIANRRIDSGSYHAAEWDNLSCQSAA